MKESPMSECECKIEARVDEKYSRAMMQQEAYEAGYAAGKRDAARRGHWCWVTEMSLEYIDMETGEPHRLRKARCSLCGKTNGQYQSPFCPNCGARMDEESEIQAHFEEVADETVMPGVRLYRCSNCQEQYATYQNASIKDLVERYPRCCICGAKMDEEG